MEDFTIFEQLCHILKKEPVLTRETEDGAPVYIWSDGDKILCESELVINLIADILDATGYDVVIGYYDPDEEHRVDCPTDEYIGNYYVDV